MTTEAEKATDSVVRKKVNTRAKNSLSKKATKPISIKGKTGTKMARKKKPVKKKRKGFVAPKVPTIYDLHPMRKYFEIILYECYLGEKEFNKTIGLQIRDLDSIEVSKAKLETRIKLKAEILETKKYISRKIMRENHHDQKVLMWDYLRYGTLPKTINLRYHFIPAVTIETLKTYKQREAIEAYTTIGLHPEEIANILNRNPELVEITAEEIEVYQYFFWNLDPEGIMPVYPVQILADYILQLREDVNNNYHYVIDMYKKSDTLTDEVKEKYNEQKMVNTPYNESDKIDLYKLWSVIVFNQRVPPLHSFRAIISVSNGDISLSSLNQMVQVVDYSVLSFDEQMQELSQKFVNAAENAALNDPMMAMALIRGGILPMAQAMALFQIPKKGAGSNLANKTDVYTSKVRDLKKNISKALIIDPHTDKLRRQTEMLEERSRDAEFSDLPNSDEIGQS